MRWRRQLAGGFLVTVMLLSVGVRRATAFGLEDWIGGKRWHYDLTRKAAHQAGFGAPAAAFMAWHNDALDVYLQLAKLHKTLKKYPKPNFLIRRLIAYAPGHPTFRKGKGQWLAAHFDDVFSPKAVVAKWRRYFLGTLYGLLWAAERRDVMSAFTILGVAMHAFEDFFSHSTWVNDHRRRNLTPFDFTARSLAALPNDGNNPSSLWTAGSEHSPPRGEHKANHGNRSTMRYIPPGMVCGSGLGINLDRTCSAKRSYAYRRLTDTPGWRKLVWAARDSARRAGRELLRRLGAALGRAGHGDFWRRLKTYSPAPGPEAGKPWPYSYLSPYNQAGFGLAPWGFLTGGAYNDGEGWYLRVYTKTRRSHFAETYTYLRVDGKRWRLDHPHYRDFGAGRTASYFSGPHPSIDNLALEMIGRSKMFLELDEVEIHAFFVGSRAAYGRVVGARNLRVSPGRAVRLTQTKARPLGFTPTAFGSRTVLGSRVENGGRSSRSRSSTRCSGTRYRAKDGSRHCCPRGTKGYYRGRSRIACHVVCRRGETRYRAKDGSRHCCPSGTKGYYRGRTGISCR